jgi:hypothetical protein
VASSVVWVARGSCSCWEVGGQYRVERERESVCVRERERERASHVMVATGDFLMLTGNNENR